MLEGSGEGENVARAGAVEGDAGEEAVKVQNPGEAAAELFTANEVLAAGVDGSIAGLDGDGVDHGSQQRGTQQALAHGGAASVEGTEEGDFGAGVTEEGLHELKVARGDLVEVKALGASVVAEGVDVGDIGLLGGTDVVDDRPGGDGGGRMAGEAETFEGPAAELVLEQGNGEVGGEDEVVDRGPGFDLGEERVEGCGVSFGAEGAAGRGENEFGRGSAEEFFDGLSGGSGAGRRGAGEFCCAELAGREVEDSDACGVVLEMDGGEVVGLFGGKGGIESSAGSEDAGDFTADDLLRQLWVFHLIADRDAIAETE